MSTADAAFITVLSFVAVGCTCSVCLGCILPAIAGMGSGNSQLPANPKTLAYEVVRTGGDLEFNHMKDPLNTC
jgi:hypothetical protein